MVMHQKYAAKAILQNKEGNVLLLTNSATHPRTPGKFDLPGGVIEKGESPIQAVIREIREETGIELNEENLTLGYSSTNSYQDTSYMLFLYVAHLKEDPVVALNYEHDAYGWFSLDEAFEKYEHPAYLTGLRYLTENSLL